MSEASAWIELVDNMVLPDRVAVEPYARGRARVRLAGEWVVCTREQWRAINTAVEEGFSSMQVREVPATTRKGKVL